MAQILLHTKGINIDINLDAFLTKIIRFVCEILSTKKNTLEESYVTLHKASYTPL